jgi:hypothetical protein
MKKLLIIPALLLLASCGESKSTTSTSGTVTEKVMETKTIEGKVTEIQNGKDGYTAKVEVSKKSYFVTISRINLKNPAQYKSVKVGDALKVSGEFWKLKKDNYITAREIL